MRDETVYWMECTAADVPADNGWLTGREQSRLQALTIPKRSKDWRLGRWTAKAAVRALEALEGRHLRFTDIEIGVLPSGAPRAYVGSSELNLSISHRDDLGLCVVSRSELPLGCDIEIVEPRVASFTAEYFTAEEQDCICRSRDPESVSKLVTLFWSAKESVLKALQLGLRCPLTYLSVALESSQFSASPPKDDSLEWGLLEVSTQNQGSFQVRWAQQPPFVITVATLSRAKQSIRPEQLVPIKA
jgi:4'-phosphopantetheinyl transferase